jgi:FkbM family methyltransferase
VDLTVLSGEVGISCLSGPTDFLCEAFREVNDGRTTVTLALSDFSQCRSLLFRNASPDGRSTAEIHDIAMSTDIDDIEPRLLVISPDTFARYGETQARVPPGFTGDWLGVVTRANIEWSTTSPEIQESLLTERIGPVPLPTSSELLLDWEPLLAAVELAGPKFTAVALGAGWGRWIVGSAFAAKKRGRDYHIVGVEAEPQHFGWMQRHLADNGIPPEKSRLIQAAANSYTGTCWFMVGNAIDWYGQAVVTDAQYHTAKFMDEVRKAGGEAEAVPCVDLNEVFAGIERVDYLHMDVQGSEADVILACKDLVDERVAVVNIGTHSELIERSLRSHFARQGWLCRYDIPMNATFPACIEGNEPASITLGDGVQVWENPRLTGRTEIDSYVVETLIRG